MWLGLTGVLHDCAFAVVNDGWEVELHCELERDIRVKETPGNALIYFLEDPDTQKYDHQINGIAFYAHPSTVQQVRSLEHLISTSRTSLSEDILSTHLSPFCRTKPSTFAMGRLYDLIARKPVIRLFGHHLCHAAEAAFRTDFKSRSSLILTMDGGGFEIDSSGVLVETHFAAWRLNKESLIEEIKIDKTFSLGCIYDLVTELLGFSIGPPKGSQVGSTMGLAAYGNPSRFKSSFENPYLFQNTSAHNPYREKVFEARKVLERTIESICEQFDNVETKADVAAALQEAFESHLCMKISNILIEEMNSGRTYESLILSGGCALNCAAVGKLRTYIRTKHNLSVEVHVSNVPYDAGLSIGAALLAVVDATKDRKEITSSQYLRPGYKAFTPYLGRRYSVFSIHAAVTNSGMASTTYSSISPPSVYSALEKGAVVAVFNGRSESGRRALGNRSLLADPRIADIRDILNSKVKHRPLWRPFAPVILDEFVSDYFEEYQYSPYMSHAIKFKESMISRIPSVVHADGTGRLQTVNRETNEWLYEFLRGWYKYSGVPMLINTSFNDNEPIVETPYDAISCFKRTLIDYLLFPDIDMCLSRTS